MPQLESLYVVEFGDVAGRAYRNGGVAVLETNRVFGGDSGYYYVGTYSVSGKNITAAVKIVKHNPGWQDAFGTTAQSFAVNMKSTINDNGVIQGHMERGGTLLPVRLTWKENLP